ncbi:glycosyltransferase [Pedobacter sp. Du54]|uniref:glycosyltransferase n=1 Tax=Pedobacter anseongensis TaxID=3133439 RepID=UPI0030A54C50
MKKVLIISPYFPPANAADMQRVRMSLPYFENFGWEPQVVTVDSSFVDIVMDKLLVESVPQHIKIHKVKAFSKKWTSKFGLGSLAIRSLWFYKQYVNQLLNKEHFDLIYFSTTQFPVMILGSYWKNKYKIPYVIDMQDPWHSEYYEDKPKEERPKKYWFSYRLNKYLEPIAMKNVDGLISVSNAYLETLMDRYPGVKNIPKEVITFGAFDKDFLIAEKYKDQLNVSFPNDKHHINFVYVGRGGYDMREALNLLFKAFKTGLINDTALFSRIKFHFIGTSYAPAGEGIPTISTYAKTFAIEKFVTEKTDRISFYQTMHTLLASDVLIILGSNDIQYTASKIYPYILAKRPILSFFHPLSSASKIIKECNAGYVISLKTDEKTAIDETYIQLKKLAESLKPPSINWEKFNRYTAEEMTKKQCALFDKI